ncbi:MAG: hypothetical protein RR744_07485, partial [Cellulosilyticaceae bacterium]
MSIQEASNKVNSEMQQANNSYVQVIGDFLLKEIIKNKDAAEKIANSDKTIMGSLDAMRDVAAKNKTGNYAVLTDDEGFNVVCGYYGFKKGIIEMITRKGDIETE